MEGVRILSVINVALYGILFAVLVFVFKDAGWRSYPLISVCAGLFIIYQLLPHIESISGVFRESGVIPDAAALMLKIVGIGYICGFSADMCRDLGAGEIAAKVEMFGKFEIIILVLPVVKEILDAGMGLLK